MTYQALLKAIKETESEYGEGRATARAKSATVADETGIAELKDKIEALTTIVKSSNVISAGMKPPGSPKPKHGNLHKFQQKDGTIPSNSPLKGKGPITSAARPFKEGLKLIVLQLWWMGTQMEKLPNHRKRGLEEFEHGQTSSNRKGSGPKSNPKVTVEKNGILEGGREYCNPDPLY